MPSIMLHRLEGRLFIADGSLCMVVRVDVDAGQAQVSSRTVEGQRILCLLYTSPSPRDQRGSRMPSSA